MHQMLAIWSNVQSIYEQGKVGNTVNFPVPNIYRGRCDLRNILEVIMKSELTKDLYRIGTKDGILNFLVCKKPNQYMYRGYC